MKHLISAVILLIASMTLVSAASPKDVKTIHAARKAFNEAIAKHDIELMRSFLAEDYVITISSGEIVRSRDAHIKAFADHFKQYPDVTYVRTPSEINVSQTHSLAIEHGTWVGTRTTVKGVMKNSGEYTAAWKRTEKGWVLYTELYVSLACQGEGC